METSRWIKVGVPASLLPEVTASAGCIDGHNPVHKLPQWSLF